MWLLKQLQPIYLRGEGVRARPWLMLMRDWLMRQVEIAFSITACLKWDRTCLLLSYCVIVEHIHLYSWAEFYFIVSQIKAAWTIGFRISGASFPLCACASSSLRCINSLSWCDSCYCTCALRQMSHETWAVSTFVHFLSFQSSQILSVL